MVTCVTSGNNWDRHEKVTHQRFPTGSVDLPTYVTTITTQMQIGHEKVMNALGTPGQFRCRVATQLESS